MSHDPAEIAWLRYARITGLDCTAQAPVLRQVFRSAYTVGRYSRPPAPELTPEEREALLGPFDPHKAVTP